MLMVVLIKTLLGLVLTSTDLPVKKVGDEKGIESLSIFMPIHLVSQVTETEDLGLQSPKARVLLKRILQ